jgi:hypothetical protein
MCMKRLTGLMVLVINTLVARADEGMWLPHLLGAQQYANMKAKGLKLTAEQLYSINKASIKDAIVIFGKGCTGEVVSNQGLIFTNHHCGYGAISAASSVQNNYLENGFYAKTKADEIPAAGLTVQFLVKIEDISPLVLDSLKTYPNWADWTKNRDSVLARIARNATAGTGFEGTVYSMFKDNQFCLYTYQRFTDVRLVGTPPESVGKFGGDTDNWEWPRHTGDFSIFRVYTAPDGSPAPYNAANVPLKPKYVLPISLKGVKDGDFSMIFGYPGSTNRYETSYGVNLQTQQRNPAYVLMRDIRLKAMFEEMKKSPANKLALADQYASLANYWKFFDGETKQLLKYDVAAIKKKQEEAIAAWIKAGNAADFLSLFAEFERCYAAWRPYETMRQYYEQGLMGTPNRDDGPVALRLAQKLEAIDRMLVKSGGDVKTALSKLGTDRSAMMKGFNKAAEQQMLWQIAKTWQTNLPAEQHPVLHYNLIKQNFGALKEDNTWRTWSANAFANSLLVDDAKWAAFVANPDGGTLQNDPIYACYNAYKLVWNKYKPQYDAFVSTSTQLGNRYLKAMLQMQKGKTSYPDANFSMRTSFGQVKAYRPRDGVQYDAVCTAKGLLEKYVAGDYEFNLPANQVELLRKKDYGPYADGRVGDMVVSFITTDDITGGNSGSPVLNANGELIGLCFDGNYEALSHKINFDKNLCRTICLDIRYMLWCVDKLGGAGHLIKELKLVK